jgi:hypothetical protein
VCLYKREVKSNMKGIEISFHRNDVMVILIVVIFSIYGCDSGGERGIRRHAMIHSISPDSVSIGDTVVIEGSGFETELGYNRIAFSPCSFSNPGCSRETFPLSNTGSRLVARVPDGAFTGGVRVENMNPISGVWAGGIKPPPYPSNQLDIHVDLVVGDVGRVLYSGSNFNFSLHGEENGREYLVLLFNSASPSGRDSSKTSFHLSLSSTPGDSKVVGSRKGERIRKKMNSAARGERTSRDTNFESKRLEAHDWRMVRFRRRIREQIKELLQKSAGRGKRDRSAQLRETGPVEQIRTFSVLDTISDDITKPDVYTQVEAELMYQGSHTLLYVDKRTPSENITSDDAEELGDFFDQSVYSTNHSCFGVESDINGDGKVAILLSPVVNELTDPGTASSGFIAGFFNPIDLLPELVDSRTTNGMEIFYCIVPDPAADFGNEFPKDLIMPYISGVLPHEFLHMIMFNYRILIYGDGIYGTYQEKLWLEESMAHIAENLNGHDQANAGRVNLFLRDPGDAHLIYNRDDALEARGAGFLFLRLMGDRFGDEIYKDMVQSRKRGRENVKSAVGEDFMELFIDWGVSCYLSGRGVTGEERYNYTTINFDTDFSDTLKVVQLTPYMDEVVGDVEYFSPEYLYIAIAPISRVDFNIESAKSGCMNMVLVRIK